MYDDLIFAAAAAAAMILVTRLFPRKSMILPVSLVYLAGLIYLVWFTGSRTGLGGVSIKFPLPFWKALLKHRYSVVTNRSVLNMLLFVPFGYLLPLDLSVWCKSIRLQWWKIVLAGFLASLLIEVSQLVFKIGVFELDDLVKNTLGTGIGYAVWSMLWRKRNSKTDERNTKPC